MIPVFLDSARKHKNLARTYKNWLPDVKKAIKPQDLHEILDVVLESYIKIQDTGFYWDLRYKKRSMKTLNLFYLPPIYALIQMKPTNCADITPLKPAVSATSADIVQSQH
jgi:hypothetical protein